MTEIKRKSPKRAVFPNLAAFVAATVSERKKAGVKAGTRAMERYHLYCDERKKIFGRHDQRHPDVEPRAVS